MRKALGVLLTVVIVFSFGVLGLAQEKKPLIAFSQCAMNHPWRVAMTNDILYWAEKYGVDLIWNDGEMDAAIQLTKVRDLLLQSPDALIISPFQATALDPVKELCDEKGIPLVCIDRSIDSEPGTGMYISFIGKDNVEISKQLGQFVADYLYSIYGEYKGNIVEIQEAVGSSATIERYNGFREALAQYPNIKIIASQTGHGYRLEGTKVMENYLERFPAGSIDIVYTHSDEMALGALQAIKAAGRTELVGRIVTIDGQRAAIKAVVDGELLAVADYAPHFGEAAFRTILEYLEGKEVAPVQMLQFNMYHMQTAEGKAFTTNYYNRMLAEDLFY